MPTEERVLIVITKSNWGGAQRHIFDLAHEFQKKGVQTVVALGGDGVLFSKLNQVNIKTYSITSLERNLGIFKDIRALFSLAKIIKKEKPTVIHLHSPKAGGLGCLLGRILNIPKIVYTVHGWAFNEDRIFIEKILIKIFSFFTVLLSHKTIVLSKNELPSWPFTKNKFEIIPVAIDTIPFFSKEESREKIGQIIERKFENHTTIVGTIAELHKNKSLNTAVKAMRKVSNSIFIIIGDGEEKIALLKLIGEENLKDKVFLAGFINEASKYLKAFDIFILPSIKEGLPYVILEAGLAGIPVIATNVGGIPEIIDDNVNGILINPQSVEEIEKSLILLGKNDQLQKDFGAKLQQKVERSFKLEKMIEKTEEVYKSI